jgi:hypothetical protein
LSYMETGFWMLCGERQIRRVRENYLRAVLRQVERERGGRGERRAGEAEGERGRGKTN